MIPDIQDIVSGVANGTMSNEQAIKYLLEHIASRDRQLERIAEEFHTAMSAPDSRNDVIKECAKVAICQPNVEVDTPPIPWETLTIESKVGMCAYAYRKGQHEMAEEIYNALMALKNSPPPPPGWVK